MNEASIRCRRNYCTIRSHNHDSDNIVDYFKYSDKLAHLYRSHYRRLPIFYRASFYISWYKKIKYDEYNEKFIFKILENVLEDWSFLPNCGLFYALYTFEVVNTYNVRLFFLKKRSNKLYHTILNKHKEFLTEPLFAQVFPEFNMVNDYYEFIVYCYMNKIINRTKQYKVKITNRQNRQYRQPIKIDKYFWNDFSNEVEDVDNVFSDIVSFL